MPTPTEKLQKRVDTLESTLTLALQALIALSQGFDRDLNSQLIEELHTFNETRAGTETSTETETETDEKNA